jgi:hypothetical protein
MKTADQYNNTPNGHTVQLSKPAMRGGNARIILAKAPEGRGHRYVVARQYPGMDGWSAGYYCHDYKNATDAFNETN